MKNYWLAFLSSLFLLTTGIIYHQVNKNRQQPTLDSLVNDIQIVKVAKNGKDKKQKVLRKLYTKDLIDTMTLPNVSAKFIKAMENQKAFLRHFETETYGDLKVSAGQIEDVLEVFRSSKSAADLSEALEAYQICGDGKGNVKFTGYYSPIVQASHKRNATYNEPIYLAPSTENSAEPTAKIKDRLNVVYVKSEEDIKAMRMEGLAYLKFSENDRVLVSFEGGSHNIESDQEESDHDLTTTEPKKVLTNYSVFTQRDKWKPVGAAKVPLVTDLTIAVDEEYIPLGSVLLAKVPILDEAGNLIRHEYRYVLAQDTGSRIRGTAHIDLYMGEGDKGKERIKYMNKYGKIWLLLPKAKETKLVAQNL